MKERLIGYRKLDFTSEGTAIKGTQIFTSAPEKGVEGEMTYKHFLSEEMLLPTLEPGMILDIVYNRKGKPEQISTVPSKQISIGK